MKHYAIYYLWGTMYPESAQIHSFSSKSDRAFWIMSMLNQGYGQSIYEIKPILSSHKLVRRALRPKWRYAKLHEH